MKIEQSPTAYHTGAFPTNENLGKLMILKVGHGNIFLTSYDILKKKKKNTLYIAMSKWF
jgi:hypothetical protein